MKNELQVFENEDFGSIRAVFEDGEPWFIARDVCDALLIHSTSASRLDDDEKALRLTQTQGGMQKVLYVNEAGMYQLIFKSRRPEARAFKKWMAHEVLPAIRKTGGYMVASPDETPEQLMARALKVADDTIRRVQQQNRALTQENEAMRPKALFADAVAASSQTILIGELAKLLAQNGVGNMGQNRLFAWMRDNGYLVRRKGTDYNMPTQRSMDLGLFQIKETAVTHADGHVTVSKTPKVTGRGQRYFIEKFLGEEVA